MLHIRSVHNPVIRAMPVVDSGDHAECWLGSAFRSGSVREPSCIQLGWFAACFRQLLLVPRSLSRSRRGGQKGGSDIAAIVLQARFGWPIHTGSAISVPVLDASRGGWVLMPDNIFCTDGVVVGSGLDAYRMRTIPCRSATQTRTGSLRIDSSPR